MKREINLISLVIVAILVALPACTEKKTETTPATPATQAGGDTEQKEEQAVVGRITFLEKNLFRYLEDAKDWALAARDVPVGDGDVLYSDVQGRSELTFPNDTKIRINDKTKIKIDGVKENLTSVYVNSGVARIQNRSADTAIKVETPFGQVLSKQPSAFDVYVGDSSAIVTGVNGSVRFVDGKNNQYDVKSDADSLQADQGSVASSRRYLDSRWDAWNRQMDGEAIKAEQNPSPYLPPQLQSETQALAESGNWEQLSYNGETANYWSPRNVAPDWSPFTVGRWTTWSGEQLWVPYERFGWVTHHHGGWIHYNGRWYWRPPVRAGWRVVPWYPARVVWVNHGRYVGWVPLSVHEPYYGRRYWGPRTIIYNERIVVKNIVVHKYVNVNRVVVVDKDRLYGTHRRYQTVRDATVVKQVVSNGQATPGLTREAVRGANLKMEHHFANNGDLSRRPRVDAVKEFEGRRRNFGDRNENAGAVTQRLQKASLKTPEARSNQPPPFAKSEQENRRNLPETPRERQKQRQEERRQEANTGRGPRAPQDQQPIKTQQPQQQEATGRQQQQQDRRPQPGQHEPGAPQQAELRRQEQQQSKQKGAQPHQEQAEPRQQRMREAELRRQQQQEQQVERQKQQQEAKSQRQQQEPQRSQQVQQQQPERQKQQQEGKRQKQAPQQKQGHQKQQKD
jgi:hypothetical protein